MGVVTLCALELTSASSWSVTYFSHPAYRCPVCDVMYADPGLPRRSRYTQQRAMPLGILTIYFPKDGSGVVSVRVGNIGYSILGSCPVSEFKNAAISFSSLSPSLTPS